MRPAAITLVCVALTACGGPARLPLEASIGPRPDLVARAIPPDFALGPHVAALGLTFSPGQRLGPSFAEGAFVGEHGSWNRIPQSGYKVVFVPFSGAQPSGMPRDVLTGFVSGNQAFGRPVGVQIGRDGSLLVADDVGNTIWWVDCGPGLSLATRLSLARCRR